jgi:hypothetical protein
MAENGGMPVGELVSKYIEIREAIEQMKERQAAELAVLESQFEIVSANLLGLCNSQDADSIRTPHGTVTRRVRSRYWTSDWESMYEFIQEHNVPQLLEQRIHNGNMRLFLEENPDMCPAGLQADNRYVVQVRKAKTV